MTQLKANILQIVSWGHGGQKRWSGQQADTWLAEAFHCASQQWKNDDGSWLTAAGDAGVGDLMGALAGNLLKGLLNAHLLGGAGDVDGHIVTDLVPLQLVHQEALDELDRLI